MATKTDLLPTTNASVSTYRLTTICSSSLSNDEPSCLPSGFSTSDSSFFFSPGVACPSGYWTACHDTTGVSSITTVTCCPIYGDITLSCVPTPETLGSICETLFCTWTAPPSPGTTITVTKSLHGGRTSTVIDPMFAPGGINAYGVRMLYESSDLQTSTSTPATITPSASTDSGGTDDVGNPNTSNDSAGPGPSQTTDPDAGSTGELSMGAKVAIGVAVPVVVLGVALLGLTLWWRRRKRVQQQLFQSPYPSLPLPPPPPIATTEIPGYPGHQQQQLSTLSHSNGWTKPPEYVYSYYSGGPPSLGPPLTPDHLSEMPNVAQTAELPSSLQTSQR